MAWDVPDDWGCYYTNCGSCGTRYHMSEGGCDCYKSDPSFSDRPWLEESGYDYQEGQWSKLLSTNTHTARRDHADGQVKKGERYRVQVTRYIDDKTGERNHHTIKRVLASANFGFRESLIDRIIRLARSPRWARRRRKGLGELKKMKLSTR